MRHGDNWGWRIRHEGQLLFVPDARWTAYERNGRQALPFAGRNVLVYRSAGHGRR